MSAFPLQKNERLLKILVLAWIVSLIFSIVVAETLAIAMGLLWLGLRRQQPRSCIALDRPIMVFFCLRLLTIATALSPAASIMALRKIPFVLIFFPISHLALHSGPSQVAAWLRLLVFAGMAASLLGLIEIMAIGLHRLESTTAGATTLAMFLTAGFTIALALQVHGILPSKKLPSSWSWAGIAVMLLALTLTYCRAPWGAACLVGLCLLWRYARRYAFCLLVAVIVILAVIPSFRMRFEQTQHAPQIMGDRTILWQQGWELAQARPLLGYGPESFRLLFDQQHRLQDPRAGAWHNFILQLWIESGLSSVLALCWILWEGLRLAKIGIGQTLQARAAAIALCAGILTLLLAGSFGGLIGDPIIDMLFWGMLGMLVAFQPRAATLSGSR